MTGSIKQRAFKQLGLWLSAWALLLLQPCCDVLGAAHAHAPSPIHTLTQAGHSHHQNHSHEQPQHDEHDYCDNGAKGVSTPPSDVLNTKNTQSNPVLALFPTVTSIWTSTRIIERHPSTGPPGTNKVYLYTLRLRI